jgi:hypothetical protein
MRQRLEQLEGMVRNLCKAVDINTDLSKPGRLEISAEALKHLRLASTPEPTSNSFSNGTDSMDLSESDSADRLSPDVESFEDAPLLHLFKAAMLIEENNVHGSLERTGLTARHRIQACIKSLSALIPNLEDLTLILQTTEKYWPLWQAFPEDVLPRSGHPQSDGVAKVRNYILESMRSGSGVIVAKAVLCLALCVQQLPASFKHQRPSLPATPNALVDSYLAGAETLLPVNEGSAGTLDGLECFLLQQRLYVNMGKPRSAWLCLRRSMSYALLQGLHNLDDSADERRKGIWSHIWQHDRFSSLILGLPPALADTHPGISRPHAGQSIQEQVIYELSIIAGHISERNLNQRNVNYSVTERIERELIECRSGIGSTVLNMIPSPSMPLETVYGLQTLKLYYHNIRKHVHLPYMLKSSLDEKYTHNRLQALDAAREMITSWRLLRDYSGSSTLIVCDLMDFMVFTAAITITLNLLSQSCPDPIHQQASDWELIHVITKSLNNISAEMECKVACQAARLLEYLSAAHQGTFEGPETYEAVIPYFGKVRISQIRAEEVPQSNFSEQELLWNRVEFNADSFVPPFSQNYMGDYLTEAELGIDWTSVLSMDNNGYDWSQSYDSSSFTMI